MAILKRKWWRLTVQHRSVDYGFVLGYSEQEHAKIAFEAAKAERPRLFYRVFLDECIRDLPLSQLEETRT